MDTSTRQRSRASASRSSKTSSTPIGATKFSRRSEAVAWSVGAGLEGKGVIVTGAAGGIGQAGPHSFAAPGARGVAIDLHPTEVDGLVAGLTRNRHICGAPGPR